MYVCTREEGVHVGSSTVERQDDAARETKECSRFAGITAVRQDPTAVEDARGNFRSAAGRPVVSRSPRAQARSGELVVYPAVYRLAGRSTADVETFSPRDTTR
jgi:hypothetical protein